MTVDSTCNTFSFLCNTLIVGTGIYNDDDNNNNLENTKIIIILIIVKSSNIYKAQKLCKDIYCVQQLLMCVNLQYKVEWKKRCAFSFYFKVLNDDDFLILSCKLFHSLGPAHANNRSLKVILFYVMGFEIMVYL